MQKRLVAGVLWYLATLTGYSLAALVLEAPGVIGPIVALVVALLVAIDPAGLIWPVAPARGEAGPGARRHARTKPVRVAPLERSATTFE